MKGIPACGLGLLAGMLWACSPPEGRDPDLEGGTEAGPPAVVTEEALSVWNVGLGEAGPDTSGFQLVVEGDELAVRAGPEGIAWRAIDLVRGGDFSVSAVFEPGAPDGGAAAWGLLVGGRNLAAPDRAYTYFLVRPGGEYTIGRQEGEQRVVLVDWSEGPPSAEVDTAEDGSPGRSLAVELEGEDVRFLMGRVPVGALPARVVRPHGFAGVRVGPGLDLRVRDWTVTGGESDPGPPEEGR